MSTRRSLLLAAALLPLLSHAQTAASPKKHRLVIQVTDNDPARWNMVLNNTKNAQSDMGGAGNIDIEIVNYGPGIHMLMKDSPVADRIAELAKSGVKFAACQNTMSGMKLTKDDMLTTVEYVSAGVTELMKKQEEGWAYLRP
jgi:intracellular sulfur oxidation DsrE/DsrF family protein